MKIIFVFNYIQVGRFFDDIDPVLARKLFNTSVYSMEQEYDYQASCPVPNHKVNAGPRSFYIVSTDRNIQNYVFLRKAKRLVHTYRSSDRFLCHLKMGSMDSYDVVYT